MLKHVEHAPTRFCVLTNYSDNPRPAMKSPGYKTTPAKPGYESRIHPALSRSRGTSSPGGPEEDCQINLEMFNNGICLSGDEFLFIAEWRGGAALRKAFVPDYERIIGKQWIHTKS
ncbi:MAG: hypothetical protein HUU38_22145 [Anaerolineales bacterium]|nr:hypothetical protein [Anaerolineales bacterium]